MIAVGDQVLYAGMPRTVEAVKRKRYAASTLRHNAARYDKGVTHAVLVKVRTRAGMQSWVRLDRCEVL
jgi:hypothetical protein